jgi:hypothetical protein
MENKLLPKLSAKKFTVGSVVSAQFTVQGIISNELATQLKGLGYRLGGQNGAETWYVSPMCSTAAEIDAVRNPLRGQVR